MTADTELSSLRSERSTRRLEKIATARARGISDRIELPQIAVCGDQSAGKSSILAGVTGFPFPCQDGVCTKFATEIILKHSDGPLQYIANIIPSSSRSEETKRKLQSYEHYLKSVTELPDVIRHVGELMGLRGFGNNKDGPSFGKDILRIKISGPTGLNLSVVDLPGLIAGADEEQTENDIETIRNLVDSYLQNSRTIIVAVVQAGNDLANQGIISRSRKFDREGKRTIGVITKPDLINDGAEKRIALLAKNQDTTKLKLGFFLVKSPTPTELENGISVEQRQLNEQLFFGASPWVEQKLLKDRVGVLSLRTFLQNLLDQHIERELPSVRDEIRALTKETEQELANLGPERQTSGDLRLFLTKRATEFSRLVVAALTGDYDSSNPDFFKSPGENPTDLRLRAVVHKMNTSFSDYMRTSGKKIKICQIHSDIEDESIKTTSENCETPDSDTPGSAETEQISFTEQGMKDWVKKVYLGTRGKELPGEYNHAFLSNLFHFQSSRWNDIAEHHMDKVFDIIKEFVGTALRYTTKDAELVVRLEEKTILILRGKREAAGQELKRLWSDEKQHPITYNHYYTDNIQKSRDGSTRKLIESALLETSNEDYKGRLHISNVEVNRAEFLSSLQRRVNVNMDERACEEAMAALEAYYKVARKTFVDNVCKQVIERHLLRDLGDIFSAETVLMMDDAELQKLASETIETIQRRSQLQDFLKSLQLSMRDLE